MYANSIALIEQRMNELNNHKNNTMKKSLAILAIAVLLFGSSCNKDYNTYNYPSVGTEQSVEVKDGEVRIYSESEIKSINGWELIETFGADNGDTRKWKFKKDNKVVKISPVKATLFWKYDKGAVFDGDDVWDSEENR